MNKKNKYNILFALFLLLVGCFSASCSKDNEDSADNTSTFTPISSEEALEVHDSFFGKYMGNVHIYDPLTKKNYYSDQKVDTDSLSVFDKENKSYLILSRHMYVRLHNIKDTRINDSIPEIFTKLATMGYLRVDGIRFTSRNQQDNNIYRFEITRGSIDIVDHSHITDYKIYLRTYFKGYGYFNVRTKKLKIYLLPYNAYSILFYEYLQYGKIPLTGNYLVYELTKVK